MKIFSSFYHEMLCYAYLGNIHQIKKNNLSKVNEKWALQNKSIVLKALTGYVFCKVEILYTEKTRKINNEQS